MKSTIITLMCALSLLTHSVQTWAWGANGHALIGTVAARVTEGQLKALVFKKHAKDVDRSKGVGYFSVYPDSGWKKLGPHIRQLETITHYFHIEELGNTSVPTTYSQAKAKFQDKKGLVSGETIDFFTTIGSAPWRAEQFRQDMIKQFKAAKVALAKGDKNKARLLARDAVVRGGLMGHYVGDLSQPLHVVVDYNGWLVNQGGIHGYFETDLIKALNQTELEKLVRTRAQELVPKLRNTLKKSGHPVQLLIALARDSAALANEVIRLDREVAVIKKGYIDSDGKKVAAKRRMARETVVHFKALIVQRLALGAATLEVIFESAYAEAGSPDFSSLELGEMPRERAYVKPNYDSYSPKNDKAEDEHIH